MKTLAAIIILCVASFYSPVLSHEWYPRSCCSDKDCMVTERVKPVKGGYLIETTGEVIAYDDPRIKPTPIEGGGEYHICHIAGNTSLRVLCLFVPEQGA